MSNAALWAMIIGFFAPLVVALVIRASFPWALKLVVAVVTAAIIGTGTSYYAGQFNDVDIGRAILLAIVATIAAYETTWKDTPLLNFFLTSINGGSGTGDQTSTTPRL
jgi:hypothetical protein